MKLSKVRQQIDCLNRLHALTGQLDTIMVFLLNQKLVTTDHINAVRNSSEPAKDVQLILSKLQKEEKLQMLEYNWSLLPLEIIRIYIITDREQKEFIYG